MTITLDAAAEAISSAWKDKEVKDAGCSLSVKYEDETYLIRFRIPDSCVRSVEEAGI